MKKKIVSTIAGAVVLSSVAISLPETPVTPFSENHEAKAEGKVLSKHTLSAAQVKSAAKSMKANNQSGKEWGVAFSSIFGKYGIAIAGPVIAGSNSQKGTISIFEQAASQNKKVQVIVKSGPTPNLNKVSYKIV